MKNHRKEWRAALAAVASAAGISFSTGREIAFFFSQMGRASWIGVVFAAASFGVMCGIIAHFASVTRVSSLRGVYRAVLDGRQGMFADGLCCLISAIAAAMMLVRGGEMAALTLPTRNAFMTGMLISLTAALLLNLRGMRAMPAAGMLAAVICAAFYASLAADRRDAAVHLKIQVIARLDGSVTAAIALSLLHAALSAALAGGAAARFAGEIEKPMRFAARCALLMLTLLSAANAAILSGGSKLLPQALPTVILAARWGKAGYYASALIIWLCSVTTLAGCLSILIGIAPEGSKSGGMRLMTLFIGTIAMMTFGVSDAVRQIYPALGGGCVLAFAGLACYYGRGGQLQRNHDKIEC